MSLVYERSVEAPLRARTAAHFDLVMLKHIARRHQPSRRSGSFAQRDQSGASAAWSRWASLIALIVLIVSVFR